MNSSNMKNVVVLKDLPSNIVEEAIVVLKSNVKIKKPELIEKKPDHTNNSNHKKETSSKDYIIKEAEMLISSYISKVEKPKEMNYSNKKLQDKYKRLQRMTLFFGVTAILGIIVNFIK